MSVAIATEPIVTRVAWSPVDHGPPSVLIEREWLATNGLGGYASGTLSGACTRRYHGLLIAALPAPLGRMVMFNHLAEELRLPGGRKVSLGADERPDRVIEYDAATLAEFRLEDGMPVWTYAVENFLLEKRVVLPHLQNTVHVVYRMLRAPGPVRLRLRPSFDFRSHEAAVCAGTDHPYQVTAIGDRIEVASHNLPTLRLRMTGPSPAFVLDGGRYREVFYRIEAARGYESSGRLWNPGYFRTNLGNGEQANLIASTEEWDTVLAVTSDEALEAERERSDRLVLQADLRARAQLGAEMTLAADQFIIIPTTRNVDTARAHAAGDEVRTVIAGYHWFTDWGRDTMISLEGLTLATGRHREAGFILRTFARYVRDGLIPNLFPEGQREGLYHTADATLWFFHALDRYLQATDDQETLRLLFPTLADVVDHHVRGTRFGIGVDPRDGLLRQGAEGYQLTWMDAKVDGWVVTPRRGKAVEINALWFNALRLMERWSHEQGDAAGTDAFARRAEQVAKSFNARFWYEQGNYLYDVVDGEQGDDPKFRPNQVFAISLPHPVLESARWKPVLDKVVERLLTPVGLRSLAPGDPDYKPTYDGDLRSRDAAYHQGTVWAWLIGPFIDAWLRVNPGRSEEARQFLIGFVAHLNEACVGQISEVFDAEAPYYPRGCVAQAWSVAEVLRCWIKTAPQ
ncbi:MAG TPA: amylo-alpha-1,6-glucosidase [Pirellulales bacterium]|jgi:predicted glycogen debranching enzyme|nr:amylo-alpha-1,6-glucosidase [Pirellulales bacterium]